jgi:choice-of-anchor B domain-containing protein
VHVFHRGVDGAWNQYATLSADSADVGDGFGTAVAADGSTLLVSAAGVRRAGVVHVFDRNRTGGWTQTATLSPPDAEDGATFGSSVALSENIAVVAASRMSERAGAAYVFVRDFETGLWSAGIRLAADDVESGDAFGGAVTIDEHHIAVSAPRKDAGAGAVYTFRIDPGSYRIVSTGKLEVTGVDDGAFLGSSVLLDGEHLFVGAPRNEANVGALVILHRMNGMWEPHHVLKPSGDEGGFFGASVARVGEDLIVGAPGANDATGAARVFAHGDGEWTERETLTAEGLEQRDFFAQSMAARGTVLAIGVSGADFNSGLVQVFERAAGQWRAPVAIMSDAAGLPAVTGGQVDCTDGNAAGFECSEVDLVSFVPVRELGGGRGVRLNDIWGWTDPQSKKEYAIVGRMDGTSFVDISDPYNPVYVGNLPRTEGSPASTWRDMKVYRDHAFIVADGAGNHGMQVFDLTRLREFVGDPITFSEDAHYDGIHSAHNIAINENTGFAYAVGNSAGGETCGGGLHMINIQEPLQPTFAGCFADPTTGRASTGYSHDAQCVTYHGPDAEHSGREICFGANETALSISDVTDKDNPVPLSTGSYPNVGYTHQGWISDDHQYFFVNDELDELQGLVEGTRTLVWDLTDLDDPQLLKEYFSENKSSDHNLYIKGKYMYQSNYTSGLRIVDISDPASPQQVGFFDTVPYGEDAPGFGGSWSNYPFFQSGMVVVTSGYEGLFVLKKRQVDS